MKNFLENIQTFLTEEEKEETRKIAEECFPDYKVELVDEKTTYAADTYTNINTFLYFISKENPWKEYKIHCFQFLNNLTSILDEE